MNDLGNIVNLRPNSTATNDKPSPVINNLLLYLLKNYSQMKQCIKHSYNAFNIFSHSVWYKPSTNELTFYIVEY